MILRKINAWLSIITTLLVFDHAIFYTVWMLSRGTIEKSSPVMPRILVVLMLIHAAISLAEAFIGHKGVEKKKCKAYPKLNKSTNIQRMTGMLMIVLMIVHIIGAATHFNPAWLHGILNPIFFAVVMAHVSVSASKALITLGVGNAKVIKTVDIIMKAVCAIVFVASVIGYFICAFGGVAA